MGMIGLGNAQRGSMQDVCIVSQGTLMLIGNSGTG